MSITPRRPAQKVTTIIETLAELATRLQQLDGQTNGFQHKRIDKALRMLALGTEELISARDQFAMLGRRMIEGRTFDQWFEAAGSPENVGSQMLIELFQEGVDPILVKERAARLRGEGA